MIVAMCLGAGIFAYGITNMCALVVNLNKAEVEFSGLQDSMKEYLDQQEISVKLKKQITRYDCRRTQCTQGVRPFYRFILLPSVSVPQAQEV